jgi:hypothetical protein
LRMMLLRMRKKTAELSQRLGSFLLEGFLEKKQAIHKSKKGCKI